MISCIFSGSLFSCKDRVNYLLSIVISEQESVDVLDIPRIIGCPASSRSGCPLDAPWMPLDALDVSENMRVLKSWIARITLG